MIHYHGTPISSQDVAAKVLRGRHGFVAFPSKGQVGVVAEVCQSFALDNGAFSYHTSGQPKRDWGDYYEWCDEWLRHPACDFAVIPDVIDGTEDENDELLAAWPFPRSTNGCPVWHLHERIERLVSLAAHWPRVALGSSGEYWQVGSPRWWDRMGEAIAAVGGEKPVTKLHGLRMLSPDVFCSLPLSSADSTNAGRNCIGLASKIGTTVEAAATVIIERIERATPRGFIHTPTPTLFS